MDNKVSVYRGTDPNVVGSTDWVTVIKNIKSEKYKSAIEKARSIKNPDAYREYKKILPAVTFSGTFNYRNKKQVISTTGFIVPDLDHLGEHLDDMFESLSTDENIWFVFRSPSGDGLKCGIRAQGIETDNDIKRFFEAVKKYFFDTYGLNIDPACKDICRLTFVSYDPDCLLNENACYFDIKKWKKPEREKVKLPSEYDVNQGSDDWKKKYGQKVLETCCREIEASQPGEQHYIRLRKARLVGGFIPDYIDDYQAVDMLEQAVINSGAKNCGAAMKTIMDALQNGKANPIHIEKYNNNKDIEYDFSIHEDFVDSVSGVSNVSGVSRCQQGKQVSAGVSKVSARCQQGVSSIYAENGPDHRHNGIPDDFEGCQQMSAGCQQVSAEDGQNLNENGDKENLNLSVLIKDWIENSSGYFTVEQIDREFCLSSRTEKNNRSKIISRYIKKDLIKRDKVIKGKYHVIDSQVDWINLDSIKENSFPIQLPFELDKFTVIPPKAIIVLAGSSNAGKTAFILNTINLNLSQDYKIAYLMSEMGPVEYRNRISNFMGGTADWKKVMAASRSYNFDSVVKMHNPNGLTCIDFLEEVDGEYFKIASSIRDIYDSLNTGVSFIAIQKKNEGNYARGGQATAEKSRLYMSLDYLATQENSIVCALKIIKVKHFKEKNLQNHEIHFRIVKGCQLEPLTGWMMSSKVSREACIRNYEDGRTADPKNEFYFKTVDGKSVKINEKDFNNWENSFKKINVYRELKKISEQSFTKPFLKKSNYFFQLAGILKKKDDAA